MDLFLDACQGLGLALAAGILAGALLGAAGPSRAATPALAVIAALAGAALWGWSLSQGDHPAWPGWLLGAAAALFACLVVGGVVAGARSRIERGSPAALIGWVLVAALVLGGLALVVAPVALIAALGLLWLATARRRRAARKYEGLRVLR